ncbi:MULTISPECIES: [citrate (pro-3S)-lyase] ligase [unclassified Oceanispirochaeta]|uniref:[citrate (pro-3S)-lyase] ligase n=1 Tax=unclassified Oceanispirochaeta TaxID=2635722 RepID=UPI000E09B51F|nr:MULTISPECIES: [citrate (pro-3S)-lyase] ligase [unclassified Oceanispirochaeta]MBF9015327.1 [citrate (pro-3S)-lyase] ligase [Oceanispirochaeta sp. M2]NPD71785.1 [citrate (pro-3S)-lyase] ligase [Oceanispirochaeta sp. M1]RDG32975.1 [citrate (pro-3S)-lyase] ligase [Oceanispirochaeta sp. M1]
MSIESYELRTLNLKYTSEREALIEFLNYHDLILDKDIDYAICLEDNGKIIATGCSSGKILKCIAVSEDYQGQALTNRVMSYLRLRAYHEGINSLFLYTKPENESIFSELGFFLLAAAPDAILMENSKNGCSEYLSEMEKPENGAEAAAIVMNCNPFTLGHRFLIEKACSENETVHLFVLKEDLSVFPFKDRIEMVKQGTEDLQNLYIHEGRDYIISRATFPSYFLKEEKILNESHALLDLDLFSKRIAPELNITKRYVGEEPFCPVTSLYNKMMKKTLPSQGIKVFEIPRIKTAGRTISATEIRKALGEGELNTIKEMVPMTTFKYLNSEKGSHIGNIIREKENENNEDRTGRLS